MISGQASATSGILEGCEEALISDSHHVFLRTRRQSAGRPACSNPRNSSMSGIQQHGEAKPND